MPAATSTRCTCSQLTLNLSILEAHLPPDVSEAIPWWCRQYSDQVTSVEVRAEWQLILNDEAGSLSGIIGVSSRDGVGKSISIKWELTALTLVVCGGQSYGICTDLLPHYWMCCVLHLWSTWLSMIVGRNLWWLLVMSNIYKVSHQLLDNLQHLLYFGILSNVC